MKLFCRTYGSGPPLIILHGLYGSSDNWVSIAKKISEKYRVILPDMRNHGQSPHSPLHTYDLMAEDILELAGQLAPDRFILAGHSMGGRVAMKFAFRWPERLNALVVADISPFGQTSGDQVFYKEHKQILETITSIDPVKYSSRKDVEEALTKGISQEKTRSFILKNLGRNDNGLFEWKLNGPALLKNLEEITGGIVNEKTELPQITGFPVTFIRGEDSGYIGNEDYKKIMRIFPAAELITVKNAGHWIHADRPDAVEEILLNLF